MSEKYLHTILCCHEGGGRAQSGNVLHAEEKTLVVIMAADGALNDRRRATPLG